MHELAGSLCCSGHETFPVCVLGLHLGLFTAQGRVSLSWTRFLADVRRGGSQVPISRACSPKPEPNWARCSWYSLVFTTQPSYAYSLEKSPSPTPHASSSMFCQTLDIACLEWQHSTFFLSVDPMKILKSAFLTCLWQSPNPVGYR